MKHLLKTALCLLLCALLSLPALAEEGEEMEELTCGDYTYVLLEDGGARITDYEGEDAELTVPAELDGHPVREIGEEAFRDCDLTTVTLPDGLTAIGDRAFYGCSSLTTVTLPDGLTTIGDEAFYGCESLTTVTLPEGLTSIGDSAFIGCDSLTTVTLPEGLTSIGDSAFSGCFSLTSIILPDSLTNVGINPFLSCFFLSEISVSPDHPVFAQIDGVLYEKATKTLICYPAGKAGDSFAVPDGILAIGDSAFTYCSSLTTITLPDSLTTIGDYAFSGCESLTAVTLPESLTSIGGSVFSFCSSLTTITLPDGLTSIGDEVFEDCPSDLTLTVPRDSYACQYAIDNGLAYIYPDTNDWLNA